MLDSASNHLPLALTFVGLLIAHMFRLDERIASTSKRKLSARRTFGHREMKGDLVLVDPDGRRPLRKSQR